MKEQKDSNAANPGTLTLSSTSKKSSSCTDVTTSFRDENSTIKLKKSYFPSLSVSVSEYYKRRYET